MRSRLSVHTAHGPIHGVLDHPPNARGLVVLARAGRYLDAAEESTEQALVAAFLQASLAAFTIDLLTHQEDRFPDAHNNVPVLSRRLLDCLALAKRQLANEALIETADFASKLLTELQTELRTELPIGLCGAGPTSPVVVRVAALRDHDISAAVCRGGLIDLAGTLYLRSLQAPLLLLVDAADPHLLANSRRALQEVSCPCELKSVASASGLEPMVHDAARWFTQHFPNTGVHSTVLGET
jgi:hypothetical protein